MQRASPSPLSSAHAADVPEGILRAVVLTRLQGAVIDLATGALLGSAVGILAGRWGPGALIGLAAGALCGLRWSTREAARTVQRRRPALGSALEALLEGQGGSLRPDLSRWVEARTGPVLLWKNLGAVALGALLLLGAAKTGPIRSSRVSSPPTVAADPPNALRTTAHVEPPAYTGWPARDEDGPTVRALRGSRVTLRLKTNAAAIAWAEEGGAEQTLATGAGTAEVSLLLDRSRSLRFVAVPSLLKHTQSTAVRLIRLEALPDRPPDVALDAPAADRTFHSLPPAFPIRASARDDVGVASLSLHYTLAQGHGEGMHFKNGRVPARTTSEDGVTHATGTLDPRALGLAAGDTLVLWAEAADGNSFDGPGRSRSEARLLRWEVPVIDLGALGSAAKVPPPTALLSEREILARTLRLVSSGVRGKALRSRAAALAADQRSLRASFGFFLQAEAGDGKTMDADDKEVAESGDAHARRKLAEAVSFMWEAEAALETGAPSAAIAPERAAVKALDAAFNLVRLALRPGAPPDKPVDEQRRLRGDQKGLSPRSRPRPAHASAGTSKLLTLSRALLLAACRDVSAEEARGLGDALWALPASPGLAAAPLAAQLYSSPDAAARAQAARTAGETLARWLRPSPLALPPADPEAGRLIAQGEAARVAP